MKLLLLRRDDGTGFAINVEGATRTIQIPLAHDLSVEIERMLAQENGASALILPPGMARRAK